MNYLKSSVIATGDFFVYRQTKVHLPMFQLKNIPCQQGKIAIITGANNGLGYHTTIALAQKEIEVIMACRNLKKAEEAKQKILKQVPQAQLTVMALDLMSLDSVRSFANSFLQNYTRLDYLIENAGIMVPPFQKTKAGFESQMGVNYFAHFLLSKLLFPLIKQTPKSRIVTLSSKAHENGKIRFDNLNAEKYYKPMTLYSQSKLACLMFAFELQRKLEKSDATAIAVSAHPGVSPTNLFKNLPTWLRIVLFPITPLISHPPHKAAKPIIYAALGEDIVGGDYCGPSGFNGLRGKPDKVLAKLHAYDEEVSTQLWQKTEELLKENFMIE